MSGFGSRVVVLVVLGLLITSPADGSQPFDLADWSPLGSRFLQNSARAECVSSGASGTWSVAREDDRVVAIARTRRPSQETSIRVPGTAEYSGRRAVLEQPEGVWLGIDRTEFGGGLWWLARSGEPPQRVSQENIRDILLVDGRVTALSGLAFMTWDQGALLQPERDESGAWHFARIIPLDAAPRAHLLDDEGRLWILTGQGVVRFDGEALTEIHRGRYRGLEPDSIALDAAGRIFMGMRHLVVRLTPARRGRLHEDWLVPPWCTNVDLETCACEPGRAD